MGHLTAEEGNSAEVNVRSVFRFTEQGLILRSVWNFFGLLD